MRGWLGLPVQDFAGKEVGRCVRAYTDDETGQTEWLAVQAPGFAEAWFVPTREAHRHDGSVQVAWRESALTSSPTFGLPDRVLLSDEARLYSHYGVPTPAEDSRASAPVFRTPPAPAARSAIGTPTSGSRLLVPAPGRSGSRPRRAGRMVTLTALSAGAGLIGLRHRLRQQHRSLARVRRRQHLAAGLVGLAVPAALAAWTWWCTPRPVGAPDRPPAPRQVVAMCDRALTG